jgi:hypothetical protein
VAIGKVVADFRAALADATIYVMTTTASTAGFLGNPRSGYQLTRRWGLIISGVLLLFGVAPRFIGLRSGRMNG